MTTARSSYSFPPSTSTSSVGRHDREKDENVDDDGDVDDDRNLDNETNIDTDDDDSSSSSSSASDDGEEEDGDDAAVLSVRFHDDLTTEIHEIPRYDSDIIGEIFYNKEDYARFQSKEKKRYDKRMMKQVQQMVRDAMKDEIEQAEARGATPEEIDAMMPQTTEAICALLGTALLNTTTGPPPFTPPLSPSKVSSRTIVKSNSCADDAATYDAVSSPTDDCEDMSSSEPSPKQSPSSPSRSSKKSKITTARDRIVDSLSDEDLYSFMGINDIAEEDVSCGSSKSTENGQDKDKDKAAVMIGQEKQPSVIDDSLSSSSDTPQTDPLSDSQPEPSASTSSMSSSPHDFTNDDSKQQDELSDKDEGSSMKDGIDPAAQASDRERNYKDSGVSENDDGDSIFRRVSIFSDEDFTLDELTHDLPKGSDFLHIDKKETVIDILGTKFSSDVHGEVIVSTSPKHSPRTSPIASPRKICHLPPSRAVKL